MKKKICIIGGSIVVLSSIIIEGRFIHRYHHYKKEYYKILRMLGDEKDTNIRIMKEIQEMKIKLDTFRDKYNDLKIRNMKEIQEMKIKLDTFRDKYNDLKIIVNKIYGGDVFNSKEKGEEENV